MLFIPVVGNMRANDITHRDWVPKCTLRQGETERDHPFGNKSGKKTTEERKENGLSLVHLEEGTNEQHCKKNNEQD